MPSEGRGHEGDQVGDLLDVVRGKDIVGNEARDRIDASVVEESVHEKLVREITITREGTINMVSTIEDTQFLGFINYGSPIRGEGQGLFKRPIILTENRIEQPIFETERIATRITMAPGSYIALRGFRPDSNPPLNIETIRKSNPNHPPLTKRTHRIYVVEAKVVPRR